jgi:hypothetical protein
MPRASDELKPVSQVKRGPTRVLPPSIGSILRSIQFSRARPLVKWGHCGYPLAAAGTLGAN